LTDLGQLAKGGKMPLIPDETIEQLKRDIDLVQLVSDSGVDLKRHGADLVGRCPFHEDKTPSLVVTPSKTYGTV
jgi:DNA primase